MNKMTKTKDEIKPCPFCNKESSEIKIRRLNTAYVDDKRNYMESCLDCFKETTDYYSDLWDSYYASVR